MHKLNKTMEMTTIVKLGNPSLPKNGNRQLKFKLGICTIAKLENYKKKQSRTEIQTIKICKHIQDRHSTQLVLGNPLSLCP